METTRNEIPAENASFYSRELLEVATPLHVHTNWADVVDIPGGAGTDTLKMRRYGLLTAQTDPLTEGVTPSGKQLSITDITVQVQYYGDYVTLTDKVSIETIDPILTQTASILGEQVGESLDQITRDILVAGTTVQYASTATQRTDITALMVLNRAEVKEAVRTLKRNNARPVMMRLDPSTGYNTMPLNQSFVGIVHPDTAADLDDAVGWIPVEKYANKSDVMPGEIGSLAGVRFVESTNAKVFTGGGSGGADVYATVILGRHAYSMTRISSLTLQNIVKPLGSAGANDPLNQRATSGWKLTFAAKITNQNFLVRVEHGATA